MLVLFMHDLDDETGTHVLYFCNIIVACPGPLRGLNRARRRAAIPSATQADAKLNGLYKMLTECSSSVAGRQQVQPMLLMIR